MFVVWQKQSSRTRTCVSLRQRNYRKIVWAIKIRGNRFKASVHATQITLSSEKVRKKSRAWKTLVPFSFAKLGCYTKSFTKKIKLNELSDIASRKVVVERIRAVFELPAQRSSLSYWYRETIPRRTSRKSEDNDRSPRD